MVDAEGQEVWRWSNERIFAQVLGQETLGPGLEEILYTATYAGPLQSADAKLVLLERLATGPVGVLAGQDTAAEKLVTSLTGKPVVPPEEADFTLKLRSLDPQLIQRLTEGQARQWHLGHSATIKKGKVADFVLFTKGLLGRPKVHAVDVGGRLVWPAGD